MSPSRLIPFFLLAAAGLATACGTDTTNPGDTLDGGEGDGDADTMSQTDAMTGGDGDTQPDSGPMTTMDSGIDSGGPCVAKGCDELGFTCGMAKDNCGNDLNCEPSTGSPCTGFETCGGDPTLPNTCACVPKTCESLGAVCGTNIDDGCGGSIAACGESCAVQNGGDAQYVCATNYQSCTCEPIAESVACLGVCGEQRSDGCGANYDCDDCVTPCTPACTAGKVCVSGAFNFASDDAVCIDEDRAFLTGKYIARTHTFRDSTESEITRSETISLITVQTDGSGNLRMIDEGCALTAVDLMGGNRSSSPTYNKIARVIVPLQVAAAGGGITWTRPFLKAPAFPNGQPGGFLPRMPAYCDGNDLDIQPTGTAEERGLDFDTSIGIFTDGLSVATPYTGAYKRWLDSTPNDADKTPNCSCLNLDATAAASLPPTDFGNLLAGTYGHPNRVNDCRINDIDADGLPGLTVLAQVPGGVFRVTAAAFADTKWSGTVNAPAANQGYYSGFVGTPEEPATVQRSFLSCRAKNGDRGLGCSALQTPPADWACTVDQNVTHFTKLIGGDSDLACGELFANYEAGQPAPTTAPDELDPVGRAALEKFFKALPYVPGEGQPTAPACTEGTNAGCPAGSICRSKEGGNGTECWAKTTPGACNDPQAQCGEGWSCNAQDRACWPATCPM